MDVLIWSGMCGNGRRHGMTTMEPGAWCAAGRGATVGTMRVRPTVSAVILQYVATVVASGWCVVPHLILIPDLCLAGAAVAESSPARSAARENYP